MFLSRIKVEHRAISTKEVVLPCRLLSDFAVLIFGLLPLYYGNKSVTQIARNSVFPMDQALTSLLFSNSGFLTFLQQSLQTSY